MERTEAPPFIPRLLVVHRKNERIGRRCALYHCGQQDSDLKAIVENACAACNVISEAWCQRTNAETMEDLIKNQGVVAKPLPDAVVKALRQATAKVLEEGIAKDPVTKKVHDSYFAFMTKYRAWSGYSEKVYHEKILS